MRSSNDRSIRNIPISHPRRSTPPREPVMEDNQPEAPRPRRKRAGRGFWWWALIVVVLCAIGGLLLSTVFAGATITITPRSEVVTAPQTLQAQLDAPVGVLAFETLSVNRSANTTVSASGTKQVSRQASGVITIYNAYDTNSQRLIANTRFEAPDGKIYRIRESVTVPGGTKKADGSITPGSTSATVYADSPGEAYNRSSATTFTIPGFKNDPRYTKFSAQAQAIAGGFVGQEPAVAEADLTKARNELETGLDAELRSAAETSVPEGYVIIPGTFSVQFLDMTQTAAEGNKAALSLAGVARASIVRANDLATALARRSVENYTGEAIGFKDIAELSFALATTSKPTDSTVTLQLSGSPTLVWQYDANALKQALLSTQKNTFQTTVTSFEPAIVKADAVIRPFWSGTFPSDPSRITIVTQE